MPLNKKQLQGRRALRRAFWMGSMDWNSALFELQHTFKMHHTEAVAFLGDNTNLDPVAKTQASLIAIPFGVSLLHPSIQL